MRILIYFQHKPYPCTTGAHQRCLSVLRTLRTLGHEVTLFSSNLLTDTVWTAASIEEIERLLGIRVAIYSGTPEDTRYTSGIHWNDLPRHLWGRFCPPAMKAAFTRLARELKPDAVIVNYTFFGDLVSDPVFSTSLKIMESLDMFSLNGQMQKRFHRLLPRRPIDPAKISAHMLDHAFLADHKLEVWPEEYAACDNFDVTIAVSEEETRGIAAHTTRTAAVWAPITDEPQYIANTYTDNPVFVAAINALNIQGYLYFARKVLPLIQSHAADFTLDAAGACSTIMADTPGIRARGYVPSLSDLYQKASFAVCPLIGATGQQIKVVEAMAHGVPVVILRNVAASSPVIHGVNGLIADSPDEMAGYCLRLHQDHTLCRTLGTRARETVAKDWSHQRLEKTFTDILSRQTPRKALGVNTRTRTRTFATANAPVFSIIIDARANADYLPQCLQSLGTQSRPTRELILVIPEPPALASPPPCPFHIAPGIREAIKTCAGRWITLIRASDVLHHDALYLAARALRAHKHTRWITGHPNQVGLNGEITWIMSALPDLAPEALRKQRFHPLALQAPGTFFTRTVAAESPAPPDDSFDASFVNLWLQHLDQQPPRQVEALLGAERSNLTTRIPDLPAFHERLNHLPEPSAHNPPHPFLDPSALDALAIQRRRLDRLDFLSVEEARLKDTGDENTFIRPLLEGYVKNRWRELTAQANPPRRIAIFGAGTHTHWLLNLVKDIPDPQIVAILDDFAHLPGHIGHIPIRRPVDFDPRQADAIVLSSDASEVRFEKRVREVFGNAIPVYRLYANLPPGPYPKQIS